MSQMRIWADEAKTKGVGCARILVAPIGSPPLASRVTEPGGSTAWDELVPQPNVPYIVSIDQPGFAPFSQRYENLFEDIDITLTPSATPSTGLSRLTIHGTDLFNAATERVFLRGADAFLAYEIFLRFGPDALRPTFSELQQRYRVNCLRWWAMCVNLPSNEFSRPPFDPATFPHYFTAAPDFLSFLRSFGFYSYVGLYPDVQLLHTDLGWQQGFWDQFRAILEPDESVFGVEFQNEAAAHPFNMLSAGFDPKNPALPWVGTSYADSDPAYQTGTYPAADLGSTHRMGDVHPTRDYPSHILDCCPVKNRYYLDGRPVVLGEPDRYGWRGNLNRRQAELSASTTRAGAAGAFFHSMRGERCEPFDPDTQNCAEGWFMDGYGPIE